MEDGDDAHISGAQLYGVPEHDQGQNQRRTDEGVRWLHWLRQKGMASGVVRRGIGITYLDTSVASQGIPMYPFQCQSTKR